MSKRNHLKERLNKKLEAITFETLIVGVDIAKHNQWARFVDCRGIEHNKALKFENNRNGFNAILTRIYEICKQEDFNDSVNCFSEKCKQTSPLIISRFSTQFIILHLSLYFYTFSFLCSTRYAYAIVPPALIIDLIHENCFFSNPGIAFLNTSSFLLLFLFCTSCIN